MMLATTTYFDVIPVLGPSTPLAAEIANEIHIHGVLKVTCNPPSIIEDLLNNPAYHETLKTLDCVMYGGGPLSKYPGDQLAKTISVVYLMGSKETMLLPTVIADRTNWQYFGFSPCKGGELRYLWADLYQLFILRSSEYETSQSVFYTFPELQEFDTEDLYSKQPEMEGLWRCRGMADDLIVLSTGENVNPTGMEEIICLLPEVCSALLAGQWPSHLPPDEPKKPLVTLVDREKLLENIWPTIERANKLCFAHGKVVRDLTLFTSAGKPMLRAGKGTIQRRGTTKLYKPELDALYDKWQVLQDAKITLNTHRFFSPW